MEFKNLSEISHIRNENIINNTNSSLIYVTTSNILPNKKGIDLNLEMSLDKSGKKFYKNDILVSNIRPYFKKIWKANMDGITSNDVLIFYPNGEVNLDYLYFVLAQDDFFDYATKTSKGTKMPRGDKAAINKFKILLPKLNVQMKIASILSNLDSKIEINNKIISNLESQAQAIFKSWFVDFEPFQDGDFVESELGMIPEGWEVKSLSDIAFFKNGLAMQKYRPEINEPSLPVLKIRELNSGSTDFSSDRCSTDIDDSVKVYDGDLIFSWSGTLSCKLWTGGNAGLNQHLFKVTSEKYEKWFNYCWVKYHMNEFIRIAQDKATTMGHIKRSHLDEAKVLTPTIDIYKKIDKLMKPIIELIIKLGIQNTKLAELRDALLPKLMAGEIDVSNIKIEGEEVENE